MGARFNTKTVFSGYGIPMLKIRRSWDRLIFNMGIPILVRRHLYIETVPWSLQLVWFWIGYTQMWSASACRIIKWFVVTWIGDRALGGGSGGERRGDIQHYIKYSKRVDELDPNTPFRYIVLRNQCYPAQRYSWFVMNVSKDRTVHLVFSYNSGIKDFDFGFDLNLVWCWLMLKYRLYLCLPCLWFLV